MKKSLRRCGLMLVATGIGSTFGSTQAVSAADAQSAKTTPPQKNRFTFAGSVSFNISATFRDLGGVSSLPAGIGSPTGMGDRFYDDGFNRVDQSGLADGKTFWWGYDNASQERVSGAQTFLDMSVETAAGNGISEDQSDDPHPGFEVTYQRHIGSIGSGNWGLAAAFGYTTVGITDSTPVTAGGLRITDSFDTGGVVLPMPPFAGTATGFNQRIDNAPASRSITSLPGTTSVTGMRELNADIFSLKVGPYVEFPIWKRLGVGLSGGFIGARVNMDYDFTETTTMLSSGVTASAAGSDSGGTWEFGGYVQGTVNYAISDRWSVFAGAQYTYLGNANQTLAGRGVSLDLGKTISAVLGAGFSF